MNDAETSRRIEAIVAVPENVRGFIMQKRDEASLLGSTVYAEGCDSDRVALNKALDRLLGLLNDGAMNKPLNAAQAEMLDELMTSQVLPDNSPAAKPGSFINAVPTINIGTAANTINSIRVGAGENVQHSDSDDVFDATVETASAVIRTAGK